MSDISNNSTNENSAQTEHKKFDIHDYSAENISKKSLDYIKTNVDKDFADNLSNVLRTFVTDLLLAPYKSLVLCCTNIWLYKDKKKIKEISLAVSGCIILIYGIIALILKDVSYISYIIGAILACLFIFWQCSININQVHNSSKRMHNIKL